MGIGAMRAEGVELVGRAKGYVAGEAYGDAFDAALATAGAPLPCPRCHLVGTLGRMQPLETVGGIGSAVCAECHELVQFNDAD